MSYETQQWLEDSIRIGYTAKRGNAWWHKAGKTSSGEPNHFEGPVPFAVADALLSQFRATKVPVFYAVPCGLEDATSLDDNGQPVRFVRSAGSRYGILRDDTWADLGVFGEGYTEHQFREVLLNSVAQLVSESHGDLGIGSVGLLRGGAVAWVSIEVPESITTPEGVEFRPNLLATTAHDGSISTTYKRVVTDVVCDNTRNAALGEAGQQYKVKHSKYSQLKLEDAREALNIIADTGEAFAAEVASLCAVPVTPNQWSAYVQALVPVPEKAGRGQTLAENKRGDLHRLYWHDERVTPWTGTAWGALQAVNTYEHHIATVRGAVRAERNLLNTITGKWDALDSSSLTELHKVLATV